MLMEMFPRCSNKVKMVLSAVFAIGTVLMILQMSNSSSPVSVNGRADQKVNDVVYIKIEKAASSTFSIVFHSYGYLNKLYIILSTIKGNLINTREILPGQSWDIAPDRSKPPQMLASHARYTKSFFNKHFSNEAVYVTSIREPVKWFISYIDYNPMYRSINVNPRQVLHNDNLFYMRRDWVCQMDNHVHNNFLQWLGFSVPFQYKYNESAVLDYIRFIDSKFGLVMLTEYIPESLVLLRRTLNWSMKDIFFAYINEGSHRSGVVFTKDEKEKLLDANHNRADLLLYQHFNKTFWQKVSEYSDFYEELDTFKKLNKRVVAFCNGDEIKYGKLKRLRVSTKWEVDIEIDEERCLSLRADGEPGSVDQVEDLKIALDQYAPFRGTVSAHDLHLGQYKGLAWPG